MSGGRRLSGLERERGLVACRYVNRIQLACKRQHDDSRSRTPREYRQHDGRSAHAITCGSKTPVDRAAKMRAKRKQGQEVIRYEEELEWPDMHTRRREMEVRVERKNEPAMQYRTNVDQQEEGQVESGNGLQPGHCAMACPPATGHEPKAAHDLKGSGKKNDRLDHRCAIDAPRHFHACDVRLDAEDGQQVIRDMYAEKGKQYESGEPVV